MFIPVILGTARKGRESEKVAHYVLGLLKEREGVETELLDVREHTFGETIPSWVDDDRIKPWKAIAKRADGFIIVSPEYNHTYPGELKMLLDAVYKKECEHKPFGICAVSNGNFAGTRMVEHLLSVIYTIGGIPAKVAHFSHVPDFDPKKEQSEESNKRKQVEAVFDEVVWFAEKLKLGGS
jgi:NAD(P)H-dependent FMN reductase